MSEFPEIRFRNLLGLLALSAVPVLAGILRLRQISIGVVTEENARFLAAPWPVGLHIVGASVFCVLGAVQFDPGLRQRWIRGHRLMGRMLVPCGLVASTSGLWMTLFYPSARFDGPVLFWIRVIVGMMMTLFLVTSVTAVLRRDISNHRSWMIRAYALGMGAGSQVFTHLTWVLFSGLRSEFSRTVSMAAGWAINVVIAEIIIRKRNPVANPYSQ